MNHHIRRTEVPAEFNRQPGASTKQLNFLRSLASEKEMAEDHRAELIGRIDRQAAANVQRGDRASIEDGISLRRASEFIERLKALPAKQGAQASRASDKPSPELLPAGRYAVESDEGELRFYHVWRGTRNPEIINVYLQHGQDETQMPFKAALGICRKIVSDGPAQAAIRYGREIGECSICGRRLTNRVSRSLGIGPVCGGRFWTEEWKGIVAYARDQIREAGYDPNEDVEDGDHNPVIDLDTLASNRDDDAREGDGIIARDADDSDTANAQWVEHKNEFARQEARQEQEAFENDPF